MKPITYVQQWVTSDGHVHVSERSAKLHQAKTELWEFIRETDLREKSPRELYDWIVEHDEELAILLGELISARKSIR